MNPLSPEPGSTVSGGGPLSAEHLKTLAQARLRGRKVRRAATVASVSGWSMACFAGLTMIAVLFGDVVALVLGVALSAIAYNELRGGAMLRRLDARGARRLGFNQIALGLVIVGYAMWSLVTSLRNPALAGIGGSSGDPASDALLQQVTYLVTYGLYGSMAIVGVLVPGLTAWYYFSRGPMVRRIVQETPAWAIEAMRIAA